MTVNNSKPFEKRGNYTLSIGRTFGASGTPRGNRQIRGNIFCTSVDFLSQGTFNPIPIPTVV